MEDLPDSAVSVLPTPGSPLSSMMKPRPNFPNISTLPTDSWHHVQTFASDDIIKIIISRKLLLHKSMDDLLMTFREDESSKSTLAPPNRKNVIDAELG